MLTIWTSSSVADGRLAGSAARRVSIVRDKGNFVSSDNAPPCLEAQMLTPKTLAARSAAVGGPDSDLETGINTAIDQDETE